MPGYVIEWEMGERTAVDLWRARRERRGSWMMRISLGETRKRGRGEVERTRNMVVSLLLLSVVKSMKQR
jgi:hypothetical protein